MSLKVSCDIKSPQTTFTTGNLRAGSRSYPDVAAKPQPLWSLASFLIPQGYGFHPIKNLRNCDLDFDAPFNSDFHNKALCESGVMWIIRFVTYLSIAFHIYLLIIINFQLIIITNVSILTDPAYFVPPSCHCGILALILILIFLHLM